MEWQNGTWENISKKNLTNSSNFISLPPYSSNDLDQAWTGHLKQFDLDHKKPLLHPQLKHQIRFSLRPFKFLNTHNIQYNKLDIFAGIYGQLGHHISGTTNANTTSPRDQRAHSPSQRAQEDRVYQDGAVRMSRREWVRPFYCDDKILRRDRRKSSFRSALRDPNLRYKLG